MKAVAFDLPGVKPIVDIEDALLGPYWGTTSILLFGSPRNHPKVHLNGVDMHSSTVLAVRGDRVETKNTIYNVLNWRTQPTSEIIDRVVNRR
jgi:hypothetical protein